MPVDKKHIKPERAWLLSRTGHFIRHRPAEALLLLRMAGWVALLSLLIKFLPLPRVLSYIALPARGRASAKPSIAQTRLAQLLDALLGMNVLCFTPTCWKRAPVLHRYLALYGQETRIVFGVRKETESLLAGHAWLEAYDGRPLFEATAPRYTPTFTFPA
jgi:hypothetical protein